MKKIAEWTTDSHCRHPEHDPPNMIVLEPGIYEHECPGCKHKQRVMVAPKPSLDVGSMWVEKSTGQILSVFQKETDVVRGRYALPDGRRVTVPLTNFLEQHDPFVQKCTELRRAPYAVDLAPCALAIGHNGDCVPEVRSGRTRYTP